MPNHIMNLITLNGDEKVIEELRMKLKQEDSGLGSLDFQKIIRKAFAGKVFRNKLSKKLRRLTSG